MNSKIRNELVWFLPAVAGIVFTARVALLSTDPTRQNVIAWCVGAIVALLAIFMTRIAPLEPPPQVRIALALTAASVTALLVAQSFYWPRPWNNDKPSVYFRGTIKIGMTQDVEAWNTNQIPSANDADRRVGFDNELAQFIADHYQVKWEPVRINQSDRAMKLHEKDGVDLVISTFTITQSRAVKGDLGKYPVDFAGPYFIDTTGVWENLDKKARSPQACVVGSTTGNAPLNSFLRTHPRISRPVQVKANIAMCLSEFVNEKSAVQYVATDWTVLKAYLQGRSIRVGDANGTHPGRGAGNVVGDDPGMAGWDTPDQPQYYGVALRDNHPLTCADLTQVINDFLTQTFDRNKGFAFAFERNLSPVLGAIQTSDWHNPRTTSNDWPEKEWVCK